MKKEIILAYLGLSLMALIIGFSFIFVKIGLNFSNPYDLLAHRFNSAFLIILLLIIFKKIKLPKLSLQNWKKISLITLFYPIMCFGFQALGMVNSTASEAGLVFAFLPVLMLIASSIILKEKSSLMQKFGVIFSVLGIILIIYFKTGIANINYISLIFLFLSVLSMIGYFIIGKKTIANINSLSLTAVMIFLGFIFFNAISLSRHFYNKSIDTYFDTYTNINFVISILYLGILSSVLTSFLSNYSLKHIATFQISIFSNLNPIIAILGGVLILKDNYFWFDALGTILVIVGVLMVIFLKPKNKDVINCQ